MVVVPKNISPSSCLAWVIGVLIVFSVAAGLLFLKGNPLTADFGSWKKTLELLSGFWLFTVMFFCALLALRLLSVNKFFKGLPNTYKWHRNLGITVCIFLAIHWLVAKGPKWASQLGLIELAKKKKVTSGEPLWWEQVFKFLKDSGEWIGYAVLVLLFLALFGKFLRQNSWIKLHRFFGPAVLLGALHGVGSFPSQFLGSWPQWICVFCVLASLFVLIKQYALDTDQGIKGRVLSKSIISEGISELLIQLPKNLKIEPAQFVSISFDENEYPHPFTVVSSKEKDGHYIFSVWIKDLGSYTHAIQHRELTNQPVRILGPYGEFLKDCKPTNKMVWFAAGVGITPFVSKLQTKQYFSDTTLIWSHRGVATTLVETVKELAESSSVTLVTFDSAKGQKLRSLQSLSKVLEPLSNASFYYCGTPALQKNLDTFLTTRGKAKSDSENFTWR